MFSDDLIDADRLKNAAAPFLHTFLNCGGQQRIQHDLFSAVLLRRENRRLRFGSCRLNSTFGLKDLALARPVCTFFEAYWQDKFNNNVLPLRVGLDVASINDVMGVVEILSSRREYTKLNLYL